MAFVIKYAVDVCWVPDGAGAMEVPSSQTLRLFPTTSNPAGTTMGSGAFAVGSPVPGGTAPTAANFATAFSNMSTDLSAQLTANNSALLTRIQGFSTGGG